MALVGWDNGIMLRLSVQEKEHISKSRGYLPQDEVATFNMTQGKHRWRI